MLIVCPPTIDGAKVIAWSPIDARHHPTGYCRHFVNGSLLGSAVGMAICCYADADGFYLFSCNQNWECLTDTWHESLERAKEQAELEYQGLGETWVQAAAT